MNLALTAAQYSKKLLTALHRSGGSFPGQLALSIDKGFISRFNMPKEVILVTGTNGKTTTSNLIAESLRQAGRNVINNHRGDNLDVGIATLLATGSDNEFNVQSDSVVIEVDELTLYRQFNNLKPSALVITNFFRDQLDRAGEMETIIRKIMEITEDYTGLLILNGDDPNVIRIGMNAKNAKVHYYSIGRNEKTTETTDEASEGKFCPICGNRLIYDYYQYSHIGRFHCDHDSFGKIDPSVFVSDINFDKGYFVVNGNSYHSYLNSLFTIYNCASVLCLFKAMNISFVHADQVFRNYELKEGRNEVFNLSQPCTINLIKNPTGANEVMKFILEDGNKKNICIILNDNDQDGMDVSWIWDAHFERLQDDQVMKIVCSGLRAYDMALRLKYEGLEDKIEIIEDVNEAVKWLDEQNLPSHIMSTYTALHSTRAILGKQVKQ